MYHGSGCSREERRHRGRSPWKDYLSRRRETDPSYYRAAPDMGEDMSQRQQDRRDI